MLVIDSLSPGNDCDCLDMLVKNHMDACARTWIKARKHSELFARVEEKSDDLDP
jgi:hypothetical protein